ncbi:hypothetical protein NS506_02607 [Nocardia seriolae]|uniref:Uncharacterized protein n=1 Tax=Nocardia seriolae TaxID=37332 RepID=A0ABC8AQM7_9NOCA|nr:hypothetical protein NS506_02607 [Nocardia seriolae]RLP25022.1 hypothetical protein D6158_32985 [Nocardia seriolae]BEK90316.1 hypothetical protein NSERKGN1266_62670 [Nocardia seriolae]BEK93856.1 hypothetical protein NSER024013_17620 [Nocardia seriolae]GEM28477.1 hypothetical protein NS2_67160 [Nocardia seriolae NBRC 15557]
MGKGSSKGSVQHCDRLSNGGIGCYASGCTKPATRWIDMERWGIRRWLSTAYCDEHGDHELLDPFHPHRVRSIK